MKKPRPTLAQLRCLKSVRVELEGDLPPTTLTDLPPVLMARWLRFPPFRIRLESLLDVVRFRQDTALELAAARAAERLSKSLDAPENLDAHEKRLLVEMVRLALSARSLKLRRKRTAENSENRQNENFFDPASAAPEPIHGDVSAEEARELIRRLLEGTRQ